MSLGISFLAALYAQAGMAQALPVAAGGESGSAAQPAPRESDPFDSGEVIIVAAERLRGQLNVEQAPILEMNEADIAAVGAGSISELIQAIGPQTASSRGRGEGGFPIVLVNGMRIGSFRELRSYPPEAVAKVEVMPEEVAQRFGFAPDRRIVNVILKENFSSREVEGEYEQPDRGGFSRTEQEFSLLTMRNGARLNLNLELTDVSQLTESERDIIQTPGSVPGVAEDPDPAHYRSLIPDSRDIEATLNWARAFVESGASASLNATYARNDSLALVGLDSVILTAPDGSSALRSFGEANPLKQRSASDAFSAAASYSRQLGGFQLTATTDASLSESLTEVQRRADTQALVDAAAAGTLAIDADLPDLPEAGFDLSQRRTIVSSSKVTLQGNPLHLPAGDVSTTFDLGLDWLRIESADSRTTSDTSLTRRRIETGLNIAVPLTSRREGFLDAVGSFTANASLGFEELSDFGSLIDWSAGLNWSLTDRLDLQATYVWREVAPSLSNLGDPQVETLNQPVFDLVNGETVLATLISGGNPDLRAETQRDWRFSANWELPFSQDTRLTAEYIRNRSSDVTGTFPALTAQIEAAFPERVTRDASGTLLVLDRRPVTYSRTRGDRLVFGLSKRGSWGQARSRGEGGARRGPPPEVNGRAPPSAEQRERFMALRNRICAEDGPAFLEQVAAAIENGEDLAARFPDLDLSRAQRMLGGMRAEDGTIDRARLAQFRERICSMDPAQMRGGPGSAGNAGGARPAAGGPPNPLARAFGRNGQGRYFFSLNHTIELENQILIAQGGPLLDLLDGDAQSDFGQSRHSSRLELGMFRGGMGLRLSGTYTGSARIDGSQATGSSALFFGDIATFNLRVFANLGEITGQDKGVLKGLRLSLIANNVFDAQRRIVDANGDVPLRYQPFLLDPSARYLGIDIRKVF